MNDERLISSAAQGIADFLKEWKTQKGDLDDESIKTAFASYTDPDIIKSFRRKGGGGERGSIVKKGEEPTIGEIATSFFQGQLSKESRKGETEGEFFTPDTFKKLLDNATSFNGLVDIMKKGLQQVVIQYTQQADLLNKINAESRNIRATFCGV